MGQFAQIRGVLFDLDGVITDTARLHLQAWRQLTSALKLPWDDDLAANLKGRSRADSLGLILKHGGASDEFDEAADAALAEQKNQAYLKLVAALTRADALPGIPAFLAELQAAGFRLALASASQNAPQVLAKLELTAYFPHIVDPQTLHHGKPDPEIYLKAAASIDLAPAACIGIEDATAGIAAINAAGALSVGIGDPILLSEAALVLPSTRALTLANLQAHLG